MDRSFSLPVLVLTCLLTGLAAAFLAAVLIRDEGAGATAPVGGDDGARMAAVAERMEQLSSENRELRDRVAALELRPAPIASQPFTAKPPVTREDLAALAQRVEARLAGAASERGVREAPGDAASPEAKKRFEATVAEALRAVRKQESAAKMRRRQKARDKELEDRLARMRETLNLTDDQVDGLRTAFVQQGERDQALVTLWEAGESSNETLGRIKRDNWQQHEDALANILSPQQLQQYQGSRGGGGK